MYFIWQQIPLTLLLLLPLWSDWYRETMRSACTSTHLLLYYMLLYYICGLVGYWVTCYTYMWFTRLHVTVLHVAVLHMWVV